MEWTREILSEFIEIYRERTCLWKLKDPDYLNKSVKRKAYRDLVDFLKVKCFRSVDETYVKNKIQNLRSAFRKEMKKVQASNKPGSKIEKGYWPSLWYFNLLLFTKDQEDNEQGMLDTSVSQESQESLWESYEEQDNIDHDDNELDRKDMIEIQSNSVEYNQNPLKRKRDSETIANCTSIAIDSDPLGVQQKHDEYDMICNVFAAKLRRMEPEQQILAESLMHKIITHGLLNKLNEYTEIVDKRLNSQKDNSGNVQSSSSLD